MTVSPCKAQFRISAPAVRYPQPESRARRLVSCVGVRLFPETSSVKEGGSHLWASGGVCVACLYLTILSCEIWPVNPPASEDRVLSSPNGTALCRSPGFNSKVSNDFRQGQLPNAAQGVERKIPSPLLPPRLSFGYAFAHRPTSTGVAL